jgi:hypothetical protein
MAKKTCTKCKVPQDEEEFYLKAKFGDIRDSICKTCVKAQVHKRNHDRYAGRPGKHENVGDAILSAYRKGFTESITPTFDKSPQSNLPFEKNTFDPNKARERAMGSL